jgi:hypothetical protein
MLVFHNSLLPHITHQRTTIVSSLTGVNMCGVMIIFLWTNLKLFCVVFGLLRVFFSVLNMVLPEDSALSTETCWGVRKKLDYWILVCVYESAV